MSDHDPKAIVLKSYGDLEISVTDDGDLRLEQADLHGGESDAVVVTKEQLATLAAFIRKMQGEKPNGSVA